jgi:hypothetical protein
MLRGLLLWTSLLVVALGAAAQEKVTDDAVVARVGGEGITRAALHAHLMRYFGRVSLRQLVDRAWLDHEAERYKLSVSPVEVDARLAEVRKAAGAKFKEGLDAEGITEATLRERLRYVVLTTKVVDAKWPIKPAEDLTRYSARYARLVNRDQAQRLIQSARAGQSFEILVGQMSLDKENGGLIQPDPFMRVDNPPFFKMVHSRVATGALRPGRVAAEPIQSGRYWLVLKLERALPPDTLSAAEKAKAEERIRALRIAGLGDVLAKRKVDYPIPPKELVENPKVAPETAVAKVGGKDISYKALTAFALEHFGKAALEQLIDRAVVSQEAKRRGVTVSEAEVTARFDAVKGEAGVANFAAALESQGITEAAWRERVRYSTLGEKVVHAREPVKPEELVRLTVRYIRLPNREQAAQLLQAARSGGNWDQLAAEKSLDKGDGYVKPKPFLRSERPIEFKAIADARLQPGQIVPEPVDMRDSFAVLKLEAIHGPETLKPEERAAAVRRINAIRLNPVLDAVRMEAKIEYVVPMSALVAEAKA